MPRSEVHAPVPPPGASPAALPAAASGGRKEQKDAADTPMMAQYLRLKSAWPQALLFYRMGDFYELFFDDARAASAALDITLTRRGRHRGQGVPMCGVPVHAADAYLARLIRRGFQVAVCEQVDAPPPGARRGRQVVRREVVRLITRGTLTEDSLLEARAHNYLAAVCPAPPGPDAERTAVAWADISTRDFHVRTLAQADLAAHLARLAPGEVLLVQGAAAPDGLAAQICTSLPAARFDPKAGARQLQDMLGVVTMEGLGVYSPAELGACGALVGYVALTQAGRRPGLNAPVREADGAHLALDAATRANLELTRSGGTRQGSLLHAIDRTLTGAGARELAARLAAPLTCPEDIAERACAVAALVEQRTLRSALREALRAMPDMVRALARLGAGRAGPRDLAALRDGLRQARVMAGLLSAAGADAALAPLADAALAPPADAALALASLAPAPASPASVVLAQLAAVMGGPGAALADHLARALAQELPVLARAGGFIAPGYAAALDKLRDRGQELRRQMAGLQARYVAQTGIRALKVRHNAVQGYHVEAPASAADRLLMPPHAPTFRHRQTMANAVRFSTDELDQLARHSASAGEGAQALEQELFDGFAVQALEQAAGICAVAQAAAELDVHAGLAQLAEEAHWTRPQVDASRAFRVRKGRHPVVEAALARSGGGAFVANDCDLGGGADAAGPESSVADAAGTESSGADAASTESSATDAAGTESSATDAAGTEPPLAPGARLWLLTGPNMAGKSTFLRQNALIAILAQMGAFVPAAQAHIGVVDRLFSRVGAADDLARGRSTFMVEMVETAAILNQASARSLVILDEIGRGTATFDGLSIAWAVCEHLHAAIGCRGLFATHYHELTSLTAQLAQLAAVTMRVRHWRGQVVFLHEVAAGTADGSYGVHVARQAGLPAEVIARAHEVLAQLEESRRADQAQPDARTLPLFAPRSGALSSPPALSLPPRTLPAPPHSASPPPSASPSPHPLPPPALDKLRNMLAGVDPDALTPRQAHEMLYRLKEQAQD